MPAPCRKNLPELLLIAFVSGACIMVVEIAGARAISPYLGNTIYTWASAIGIVMAALSLGYYAGGALADRYNDRKHFSMILLAAGVFTLLVPLFGNIFVPFTILLDLSTANLLAAFILAPASFFYGMVSPYAIKLTSEAGREGQGAGRIFAISTVGSITGALGTGFLLLPYIELAHIFISAAIAMVLMSWLSSPKRGFLIDAFPLSLLIFLVLQTGHASIYEGEVVYEGDSLYYHILVLDGEYGGNPARLLILDNSFSTGEKGGGEPAFEYISRSKLAFELVPEVKNAIVLGSAGGTQVELIKSHYPDVFVEGVDIDPEVVGAGKTYFSLVEDERTRIIVDDARRYMKTTEKEYGLVLIDAFRGKSIPPHLATQEFLFEIKDKMNPGGVVAVNIISSLEGSDSEVFILVHNTFSSVFQNVVVIPLGEDPEENMNILLIATDREVGSFVAEYGDAVYHSKVPERPPLRDGLNPIEIYARR